MKIRQNALAYVLVGIFVTLFCVGFCFKAKAEVHYDVPGIPITSWEQAERLVPAYVGAIGKNFGYDTGAVYHGEGSEGGRHWKLVSFSFTGVDGTGGDHVVLARAFDDYKVTQDGKWIYTTDYIPQINRPLTRAGMQANPGMDIGVGLESIAPVGEAYGDNGNGHPLSGKLDYIDPNGYFQEFQASLGYYRQHPDVFQNRLPLAYYDTLYHNTNGSGIKIHAYLGQDKDIVVPTTIEGKQVTMVSGIVMCGADGNQMIWSNKNINEYEKQEFNLSDGVKRFSYIGQSKEEAEQLRRDYVAARSLTVPEGVISLRNVMKLGYRNIHGIEDIYLPSTLKTCVSVLRHVDPFIEVHGLPDDCLTTPADASAKGSFLIDHFCDYNPFKFCIVGDDHA